MQGGGTGLACLLLVVMACSLPVAWTCLQPFHSDLRHTCQCGMVMLCVVAGEDEGDILEAQAAWRGQ